MKFENYMILEFPSKSANEGFARSAVACFAEQLDPTIEELGDIRTAVSEAVTNCIGQQAYRQKSGARAVARVIRRQVEDPVSEQIVHNYTNPADRIELVVRDGEIAIGNL
jgi:stage II sporulation protein AB (anti-sigma F factor)